VDVVDFFRKGEQHVYVIGLIDFVFECDYRAHVVLGQNPDTERMIVDHVLNARQTIKHATQLARRATDRLRFLYAPCASKADPEVSGWHWIKRRRMGGFNATGRKFGGSNYPRHCWDCFLIRL